MGTERKGGKEEGESKLINLPPQTPPLRYPLEDPSAHTCIRERVQKPLHSFDVAQTV